ncbi:Long-chain-fatty-acid--CoA ligase [hydrothermal vent metagenome]|uniref:Long-chain-fatty-acid--CoA ligase n=1 Tax=hydrothermal vent metagenome TaxID=652676 RepID=A0A3B1DSN4_9ZZZZ
MNIVEIIRKETSEYYDHIAIIDDRRKISYKELFSIVDVLKDKLASYGIGEFKRVALLQEDGIEYIAVVLAVLSLKGVIVPISPSLGWDETGSVIDRVDVEFFLSYKKANYFESQDDAVVIGFGQDKIFLYRRKIKMVCSDEYYSLNPAFVRFSSGTTSISKGVVLSHEAILDRTNAANRGLNIKPEDNIIWVLSMSYHFVVTIILFLRKAATIILCEKNFPFTFFEVLKTSAGTLMYASPFYYRIMQNSEALSKEMLSNIRLAVSTAVEFSAEEVQRFHEKFEIEIREAYGIIEVGLPFINFSKDKKRRGSVGKILPDYKLKIINPNENGVGSVYLKGKGMFDAYFSPWITQKKLLKDGWFHTGDLGWVDDDGYLFLKGREKNVINYSGMKIFPCDVEEVLNSYKSIKESFVYGVAHPQYGQLPQADLVLEESSKNSFDRQELRKFCHTKLALYKVPKEFRIVSKIKKTASGKIKRIR